MMKNEKVIGAFSEDHAEKLTGISRHQLKRWDRLGFFSPSFGVENRRLPYSRVYSFRDLVSLRILHDLRVQKGVSLQHLRAVSDHLSHLGKDRWVKATLYVLGKRVVFEDPRTQEKQEVVSGQRILDIPLRVVVASTREAVLEMNKRSQEQTGQVDRSRFVSENQIVFAGTRIPVEAIRRYQAAGYSSDQILKEYPDLTMADLSAAASGSDRRIAA